MPICQYSLIPLIPKVYVIVKDLKKLGQHFLEWLVFAIMMFGSKGAGPFKHETAVVSHWLCVLV